MTSEIHITTDAMSVVVYTPYDPAMPPRARELNGRWNEPNPGAWTFDVRDEQAVREMVREIYGTDGEDTADDPTVSVRVQLSEMRDNRNQELRLAGRRIAWRPGRDKPVHLSNGVVVITGGFPHRGGSMANPELLADDPTVLEIRDLPRATAEKIVAAEEHVTFADPSVVDREALIAERARLTARLAEIDSLLGGA